MAITCTITAPDVDGEGPTRLRSWLTPVKTFVVSGDPLFVLSRAGKAFEFRSNMRAYLSQYLVAAGSVLKKDQAIAIALAEGEDVPPGFAYIVPAPISN